MDHQRRFGTDIRESVSVLAIRGMDKPYQYFNEMPFAKAELPNVRAWLESVHDASR